MTKRADGLLLMTSITMMGYRTTEFENAGQGGGNESLDS